MFVIVDLLRMIRSSRQNFAPSPPPSSRNPLRLYMRCDAIVLCSQSLCSSLAKVVRKTNETPGTPVAMKSASRKQMCSVHTM